jgi:type II secretory pathway pseudopilin PulG
MSDIRGQESERGKPHYTQALPALYPTSDPRQSIFAERRYESLRGLCCSLALCESEFGLQKQRERASAFTLLELLVVIGVIGMLLVLIGSAFTTITSASDVAGAIYGIKGVLENARAYAKANHTYVFVGFAEVDSSVDPSVSPQITTGDTPYGRVAAAVVASKDGTSQYQYSRNGDQGNDWTANYANGAHLIAVGKLQTYENLHFVPLDFGSWTPTAHPNSKMARYQPTGSPFILGRAGSSSVTPFTWPLGSPLDSSYQYRFDRVINFDPTGIARIATSNNGDDIAHVIEIDFQPTHGTVFQPLPAGFNQDVGNHAVIQLGTTSGAVRVYRP